MKITKTFFKLLITLAVMTQTTQEQETAKGIKDNGIKSHQHQRGCCYYKVIYLGVGLNNPSSSSNQRFCGKTTGITLDYSQTILRKPGFSIGFNVGGQYFAGKNNSFESFSPQPYLIVNQITSAVTSSGDSKNSGYLVGVGPQFNIHFANHFVFSPIFQLGYLESTQSESKVTQTTLISGGAMSNYTKTNDLVRQTETKTSGLAFVPKAILAYMISNTIGIWAEANYIVGPTSKNSTSTFAPQGEFSTQTTYSIAQIDAGTYKTVVADAKYSAVGFNFGIVYSFREIQIGKKILFPPIK